MSPRSPSEGNEFSRLPVRRVEVARGVPIPEHGGLPQWPASLPSVAQLLRDGLDLTDCTVLVGPNGSGKSTIVEAVATAYGLNPEGGSTGAQHQTFPSESPLADWLQLVRGVGASKWGYFVRAETMHGLFSYLSASRGDSPWSRDPEFHGLSHGESFVALLGTSRFARDGFFVLDEPEAGLSFEAQLHLVAELADMAARPKAQVLLATHSPVLAAIPGARIVELGEHGLRETRWEDLEVVGHYRRFLDDPRRYLRHVLED